MQLDIEAVAMSADDDTMRAVRRALARRSGPIVPLGCEFSVVRPAAEARARRQERWQRQRLDQRLAPK